MLTQNLHLHLSHFQNMFHHCPITAHLVCNNQLASVSLFFLQNKEIAYHHNQYIFCLYFPASAKSSSLAHCWSPVMVKSRCLETSQTQNCVMLILIKFNFSWILMFTSHWFKIMKLVKIFIFVLEIENILLFFFYYCKYIESKFIPQIYCRTPLRKAQFITSIQSREIVVSVVQSIFKSDSCPARTLTG